MRSRPVGLDCAFVMLASMSSKSLSSRAARSKYAAPSGVTVTRRVVRFSSFTRSRDSRAWICLVTVPLGRASESAARVKVPASTTRTKIRMAWI